MVGIEEAGRAVFCIDINVLMVVYKCNKVNRYQIINDSNQYPPANGSEMDFNLLQDSLPHSNVRKSRIQNSILAQPIGFVQFF